MGSDGMKTRMKIPTKERLAQVLHAAGRVRELEGRELQNDKRFPQPRMTPYVDDKP